MTYSINSQRTRTHSVLLENLSTECWSEVSTPGENEMRGKKKLEYEHQRNDIERNDTNIEWSLKSKFGSLTTSQLIDKVRGLQNLAYQLGLDEAQEMTRGKFLNILQRQTKRLY
ncbi:hypothetical protein ACJMK2_035975 [Sinanodonta woodiana]|uniref:Uncharacterized protein n=1 Tax=Sinanodonta woodiana TaxID=1069815 RepID=A0ABD3WFQ8_SINWO